MTKDYNAATYGRQCEWDGPAASPDCAYNLQTANNNDLETGFPTEYGIFHKRCEREGPRSNRQTSNRFITSYGRTQGPTRLHATIQQGRRQWHDANRECTLDDASPTSVQLDLHLSATKLSRTKIDCTNPSTNCFFRFNALPRAHYDALSLNTIWDGDHLVNNQSLNDDDDDDILTRLEEGLTSVEK